jgi:uncharacterized protein (TIGR02996 family)
MNDHEALLRAICDNPDDDAPRLIYADWLDEHGDPRQAEFIRVQIELARRPGSEQREGQLKKRQEELFRELRKWRFAPPDWPRFSLDVFRRGFVEHWQGTAAAFLRMSGGSWRVGPIVNLRMFVDDRDGSEVPGGEAIAKQSALASARRVEVRGDLTDEWVEAFLGTPYCTRWTNLQLSCHRLTDAVCHYLAASPLASTQCTVTLESPLITDSGRAVMERAFGDRQSVRWWSTPNSPG